MTIKRRLQISSLLYVAMALGIGFALLMYVSNLRQELERTRLTFEVITGLVDLTTLCDDYLMHPGRRSLRQWQAKYEEVGRIIGKQADLAILDPDVTNRLADEYKKMESVFSRLISVEDKIQAGESQSENRVELRDRLKSMLVLKLHNMVAEARLLYGAGQARIHEGLNGSISAMLLFVAVTGFIIVGNHFLTRRILLNPLTRLTRDTEIIGGGNLDHVVDIETGDEMGDLAQAFNRMSQDLKKSYGALEAEIMERTRAQNELQRHRDRLEELVEARTGELQNSNEALQIQTDALGRANKELEAFSYSVSHDLRAPLRAIEGFSSIVSLKYSELLDARGQDYLKRVTDECQRMGQLIDDLLKLSRLTRTEMNCQEVNLSTITREILGKLHREEPHRDAEFVISDDLVVKGDRNLLKVVLENLLNNAWKFTADKPLTRIVVGRSDYQGECVHFVKDNGAGFKMAYVDKLFGAFQRLHSATEFPGSGIGLAIVQRIIHRHGGRVWAEGIQGEGATFYFALPKEEEYDQRSSSLG